MYVGLQPFGPGQGPPRVDTIELYGGPGDGVVTRVRYRGAAPHAVLELPWPDPAGRLEVHCYHRGELMIEDLATPYQGGAWRYFYVGTTQAMKPSEG